LKVTCHWFEIDYLHFDRLLLRLIFSFCCNYPVATRFSLCLHFVCCKNNLPSLSKFNWSLIKQPNRHHNSKFINAQKKEIQLSALSYKGTFRYQFFNWWIQEPLCHQSVSSIIQRYSFRSIGNIWKHRLQSIQEIDFLFCHLCPFSIAIVSNQELESNWTRFYPRNLENIW
jgi:hypothetical protein